MECELDTMSSNVACAELAVNDLIDDVKVKVVVIGICGPSGCGKSSLTQALESATKASLAVSESIVVGQDSNMRSMKDDPEYRDRYKWVPRGEPFGKAWGESPPCYDFLQIANKVREMRDRVAKRSHSKMEGCESGSSEGSSIKTVHVFVEGHLIFCSREICELCDVRLLLDPGALGREVCMSRRRDRMKRKLLSGKGKDWSEERVAQWTADLEDIWYPRYVWSSPFGLKWVDAEASFKMQQQSCELKDAEHLQQMLLERSDGVQEVEFAMDELEGLGPVMQLLRPDGDHWIRVGKRRFKPAIWGWEANKDHMYSNANSCEGGCVRIAAGAERSQEQMLADAWAAISNRL